MENTLLICKAAAMKILQCMVKICLAVISASGGKPNLISCII